MKVRTLSGRRPAAMQARNPDFLPELRAALKRIKPEAFLLAESKATDEDLFENRFDAAYDWTSNEGYISEWAWQRSSHETTIFNTGLEQFRARDLRFALTLAERGGDHGHRQAAKVHNVTVFTPEAVSE